MATDKVVTLPGAQTSTELAEAEAAASSTQAKDKPESLMEMKSAAHQVSKLGFSLGAFVTNKGAEHVQVFEVIAVSEESAVLLERGLVMTSAPQSMTVSLKELTDDWKPFKGKVTCPLKGWSPEVGSPIASEEFCWEVLKGKISQAMMKAYDKNVRVLQHLQLMQNPNMVVCSTAMQPKELCLVAAATNVMKKTCPKAIGLGSLSLPGTSHTCDAFLPKEPTDFN